MISNIITSSHFGEKINNTWIDKRIIIINNSILKRKTYDNMNIIENPLNIPVIGEVYSAHKKYCNKTNKYLDNIFNVYYDGELCNWNFIKKDYFVCLNFKRSVKKPFYIYYNSDNLNYDNSGTLMKIEFL